MSLQEYAPKGSALGVKQSIHKRPKGNISLIMLFVLAIGSLIGLMSTNSVQDMIKSTGSLRDFYQSYYLSKGGLELGILATNRYDYGFEDSLTGTDLIIQNNLNCQNCTLGLTITSRIRPKPNKTITFGTTPDAIETCNFTAKNKIILSGGSSYILPLFADQRTLEGGDDIKNLLEDTKYILSIQSDQQDTPLGIGIALGGSSLTGFKKEYEGQTATGKQALYITGTINDDYIRLINKFLYDSKPISATMSPLQTEQSIGRIFGYSTDLRRNDNFNYLFITNLSDETYAFCLTATHNPEGYAVDNANVTSIASYGSTTIGLQANIKKPLPDYIINSYSAYQN